MPSFRIDAYHKVILPQLDNLDLTHGDSVAVARFAAGMLSKVAVPPEDLPGFIAEVDDLVRRMLVSPHYYAPRVASFLQAGVDSLKRRLDPQSDADNAILAATEHYIRHGAGDPSTSEFSEGHGQQEIGGIPITVTGARGMPDRHLDEGGLALGCPFAAGPQAHAHRHAAAPDPRTVVGNRDFGNGMPGMDQIGRD